MDEIVSKLIFNVAILFIMMLPGVILKKLKMIPDGFGKGISNLVLYIAQPALILFAYLDSNDRDILADSLMVLLLSLLAHVLFAVVSIFTFARTPNGKKQLLTLATIFSNAAFMGIPLISAVFGGKAVIFASIYNITFNLFLWSLGVFICTSKRDDDQDGVLDEHIVEKKKNASMLKALYHPVTIAAVLGILAIVFDVKNALPSVFGDESLLNNSLEMLKHLVAPLSMVVIGIRLADMKWSGFFGDFYMYVCLVLRHLVLPVAVIGIMVVIRLLGLPLSDTAFNVTLILAATPSASSATMFAEKFDLDASYVSRLVTASTLISIGTMPLVLFLGAAVS